MRFRALVAAALTLLGSPLYAQQGTAELRGVIADQQNAVLPGVSITVRNQDTGMFRETTSNPDGTYFVAAIPPGLYELRASLAGFNAYVRTGLRLEVGTTSTIPITLEVGGLEQAITVTGQAPPWTSPRRRWAGTLPTWN